MRRRKVDSIEVQQMKAQAKEEKARKKVSIIAVHLKVDFSSNNFTTDDSITFDCL